VKITWDDTETGKGPSGTAIKTKQPSLMRNIPEDPRFEPWRKEAVKRGYLSLVAIPLVHDEKVYGVLNVYSSQRDGFDAETSLSPCTKWNWKTTASRRRRQYIKRGIRRKNILILPA